MLVNTVTPNTIFSWKPGQNTLAYYTFNNTLNDSSGNNRNLTGSGSFVDGGPGKVYQVNSAYADNSVFNINGTNPFTMGLWVKVTAFPSTYDSIMGTRLSTDTGKHDKEIDIHPSGVLKAQMWDGNDYSLTSNINLSLNTWYNIIFIFTGTNRYLYINNTLVASGSGGSSRNLSQQRFGFRRLGDGQYQISNAVYENRGRSEDDVNMFYNYFKPKY